MPSRRDLVKMTVEECDAFIDQQKSLQVATINADGTPHLTTLWFDVVDGELVFMTFTKSQKIRNLQRDPRIACLLEDGTVYEKLRGVQINGIAELHSDQDTVLRLARGTVNRNNDVPAEMLDQVVQQAAAKRTVVIVKATSITSWDHTKLGGTY